MKGDVLSRDGLGVAEYNAGNYRLARKHYMISFSQDGFERFAGYDQENIRA